MKYFTSLIFIFLLSAISVQAQELDLFGLFGKGKAMKLNGGINASFISNFSNDVANRRDPFTMVIGGNINVNLAGIDFPMSFSYSNAKVSATPPMFFNKFSIAPTYKWIKTYIGTNSMTFSNYTLNGHQFDGVGFDLTPGKLRLQFMTGRLLRGTGDFNATPDQPPVYRRRGIGVAADYKLTDNFMIGVSAFHAKDDSTSAYNIPFDYGIQPKENFVASIKTETTLFSQLKISAEVAGNYLTQNMASPLSATTSKGLFGSFISRNGTSKNQTAQNFKIGYQWHNLDIGLDYEKVDLNYQSLGAYYNQNGFENSLIRVGYPFFHGKLMLAGSFGVQNDLTDTVFSQKGKRFVSSVNAAYSPIQKLTLTGSYNNNRSVTDFRNVDNINTANAVKPYYLDSLRLIQLNMNMSFNANYQLSSSKEKRQSISAGYSLQKGDKKQAEYFVDAEGNVFHNVNALLSTTYPSTTVQWAVGFNYNLSTQGTDSKTTAYGPSVTFGKKLFGKKVNTIFNTSYNTTYTNLTQVRVNVVNFRYSMAYSYQARHNFSFAFIYQVRSSADPILLVNKNSATGLATLNYNYTF